MAKKIHKTVVLSCKTFDLSTHIHSIPVQEKTSILGYLYVLHDKPHSKSFGLFEFVSSTETLIKSNQIFNTLPQQFKVNEVLFEQQIQDNIHFLEASIMNFRYFWRYCVLLFN